MRFELLELKIIRYTVQCSMPYALLDPCERRPLHDVRNFILFISRNFIRPLCVYESVLQSNVSVRLSVFFQFLLCPSFLSWVIIICCLCACAYALRRSAAALHCALCMQTYNYIYLAWTGIYVYVWDKLNYSSRTIE